jgi:hypothetical protein
MSRLLTTAVLVSSVWGVAQADPVAAIPPTMPDLPPRSGPPTVGPSGFRDSSNLDGVYVWLGPSAAATYTASNWDSVFGGDLAVTRVREQELLGAVGGDVGFTKYTANDGGRVWLDALAGTRVSSRVMVGVSAGPIVELADLHHPRVGASVGLWAFAAVTPFVRVGAVDETGRFVEIGVRIALPVFRR